MPTQSSQVSTDVPAERRTFCQEVSAALRQGITRFDRGDWITALDCFNRTLAATPDNRTALNYRARTFETLNRLEEALQDVTRSLQLSAVDVAEFRNRGVLLLKLGRASEALRSFDAALVSDPDHTDVLTQRAYAFLQLGRPSDALESAARALASGNDCEGRRAHSLALEMLERPEEALAGFHQVVQSQPDRIVALNDYARLLVRTGHFAEAVTCYDRSLKLHPGVDVTLYNRCMARLAIGDWGKGLQEFEIRWKIAPPEAQKILKLGRLWLGEEEVYDKAVLLHHEQGYGDTLQFARYALAVAALGARVILAVPAGLKRLMHSLSGVVEIISEGDKIPAHDFLCPLMSLPLALRTTPDTIALTAPYLRADPLLSQRWSERLGPRRRARVGIIWCGRRQMPTNPARDIELTRFEPLLSLPADIISLQKELSDSDRNFLAAHPQIRRLGEELGDFADTAALVENLDLVISVDSAVAHLVGALGKPVWLLNRYASCWRWGQRGSITAWYPSMRIFRQERFGDWEGVLRQVETATSTLLPPLSHIDPRSVAHELLRQAQAHWQSQQAEPAITLYRHLLAIDPRNAGIWQLLGVVYAQSCLWTDAVASFRMATKLKPDDAGAHSNLGNALQANAHPEQALESYGRAIELSPSFAGAHYNQGIVLHELNRLEQALRAFDRAIVLEPDHAEAMNNRGNVLAELRQFEQAITSYSQALQQRHDFVPALVNRAAASRRLHRYEEALVDCNCALTIDSDSVEAHCNRGAASAALGRYQEAVLDYDQALALRPAYAEALWNKGLVLLLLGRYEEGWPLYEQRWKVKGLGLSHRQLPKESLIGQGTLSGKRLFIFAEQGYGDIIQFSRFAAQAAAQGAEVTLEVPATLVSLVRTLEGVTRVIPQATGFSDFDLHCPLMSLPTALGLRVEGMPRPAAYLRADPALGATWKQRLGLKTRPRVGIVWSGKASHHNDAKRSLSLAQIEPLLNCETDFISLQRDVSEGDSHLLSETPQMRSFASDLVDFATTAALIAEMDLIISVDTAVAHLAGALGKPLWLLLPYVPDWRWLLGRTDSPWYPSARLFRQAQPDDWHSVISQVRLELERYVSDPSSTTPIQIRRNDWMPRQPPTPATATAKIGVTLRGASGLGDLIQFSSFPENYYRNTGERVVDIDRCWIFDHNPYVVRDVSPSKTVNLWEAPWPRRDHLSIEQYARKPVYFSIAERTCSVFGHTAYLRHPRLYRFEDLAPIQNRIVLHTTGKPIPPRALLGEDAPRVLSEEIIEHVRVRYQDHQLLQVGTPTDRDARVIDRRGLSDIWDVVRCIAESSVFIGVDSGPFWIAACYPHIFRKKVLMQYPTDYLQTQFIPMHVPNNHVHWHDLSCLYFNRTADDAGVTYSYLKL